MEVQVIKAMKEITYNIRVMTEEDYEQVYALWMGIGLERLTMQIIGEDNVREATLFPRDLSRLEP